MKKVAKIKFESNFNSVLTDKILVTLYKHLMIMLADLTEGEPPFKPTKEEIEFSKKKISADGLTLLELYKLLGSEDFEELRLHLMDLERKGYLEERYFESGIMDYALEQKGLKRAVGLLKLYPKTLV